MAGENEHTTKGGEAVDPASALLAALDSEIAQARDQQDRLGREVQIANAKSEVAGHYRVRFMDLRDKLREQVKAANAGSHPTGATE